MRIENNDLIRNVLSDMAFYYVLPDSFELPEEAQVLIQATVKQQSGHCGKELAQAIGIARAISRYYLPPAQQQDSSPEEIKDDLPEVLPDEKITAVTVAQSPAQEAIRPDNIIVKTQTLDLSPLLDGVKTGNRLLLAIAIVEVLDILVRLFVTFLK